MSTFPQLMLQHAAQRPQDAGAAHQGVRHLADHRPGPTWRELVRHLAGGLAEAGLQHGEHVVVIGENRPRLYAAMLATQALGGIPVPLYQDAASAEFVFPIQNADVRFAFVEDQEQVDKLIEIRPECPQI